MAVSVVEPAPAHATPVIANQKAGTGHGFGLFYKYSGDRDEATDIVFHYVCEVMDLDVNNLSRGAAEVRTRCRLGTQALPSVADLPTIEFQMPYGYSTTIEDRFWQWFQTGVAVDFFVTDNPDVLRNPPGSPVDVEGLWVPAFVSQMNWPQPLDEVAMWDMILSNSLLYDYGPTDNADILPPDQPAYIASPVPLPIKWQKYSVGGP